MNIIRIGVVGYGADGTVPHWFQPEQSLERLHELVKQAVILYIAEKSVTPDRVHIVTKCMAYGVSAVAAAYANMHMLHSIGVSCQAMFEHRRLVFDWTVWSDPAATLDGPELRETLLREIDALIVIGTDPISVADGEAFEARGGIVVRLDIEPLRERRARHH